MKTEVPLEMWPKISGEENQVASLQRQVKSLKIAVGVLASFVVLGWLVGMSMMSFAQDSDMDAMTHRLRRVMAEHLRADHGRPGELIDLIDSLGF